MANMERHALWDRFDDLAKLPAADREDAWGQTGPLFIQTFFAAFIRVHSAPEIESSAEFSEFILQYRENYRLWNQQLMKLMLEFDAHPSADLVKSIGEFALNCHWIDLADAAHNFLSDERSD